MNAFDETSRRALELQERLRAQAEAGQGPHAQPERSRTGWFFYNLRKRLFGPIGRAFRRRPLLSAISFLLLLALLLAGRSLIQPFFLSIRLYALPALLPLVLLLLLYAGFRKSGWPGRIALGLLALGLIAATVFWGAPMLRYLSLYTHYRSLDKVPLSTLPLTGNERIQPLNSIATLAAQEALNETEHASSPDLIRRADGRYDFSLAIGPAPGYPIQRLLRPVDQVLSVSATAPAPEFSRANRHDVRFDVGESLLLSRNVRGAVIRRFNPGQFFSYEPGGVRFMEDDRGRWVQVVSLVRWTGVLLPRPVFGGVVVIEQVQPGAANTLERLFLGKGRWIRPRDMDRHPWLQGQNLLPEKVSRFSAESFRFHSGFLAPFPGYHEGDIRIPDFPDDQNEMPYVTWFRFDGMPEAAPSGLYDYYGLEPYLEGKFGLNLSLLLPADGSPRAYYFDHAAQESGLFGASAVAVKVRESRKEYDWSASAAVEARPFICELNGARRFFWLSTVVTRSEGQPGSFVSGAIPDITLTDALSRQVTWVDARHAGDTRLWLQQLGPNAEEADLQTAPGAIPDAAPEPEAEYDPQAAPESDSGSGAPPDSPGQTEQTLPPVPAADTRHQP